MKIFLVYQLGLLLTVCSICSVQSQNKSVGSGFFNIFKGDFWKKGTDAPSSVMPTGQSTKFFEKFNNWINKFKGVISKIPARTTETPTEAVIITHRVSTTLPTPAPTYKPRYSKTWITYSFEASDDYYDSDTDIKKKRIPPRSKPTIRSTHGARHTVHSTLPKTPATREFADNVLYDAPSEEENVVFIPRSSRHFTISTRHTRPAAHYTRKMAHRAEESDFDLPFGSVEESVDYVPHVKRHTIHATHSTGHAPQRAKESDNDSVFDSEAEGRAAVIHGSKHAAAGAPSSVHETYTSRRYIRPKLTRPSYLDYFTTHKETSAAKTLARTIHSGHSRLDPAVLGPEVRYHYSQMDTQEELSSVENPST